MAKLPNFIIIGAMKSATTTLHEQLVEQSGIFMCDPKEPNFFSDEDQYAKGMAWYEGLFARAPDGSLIGEASTHYTKLPMYPNTIERLKRHLPDAKMIYVMRHPVDRLISHYIHEWSMGEYHCDIETAIRRYPELVAYSQYSHQLAPYFEAFGRKQVLPVFFDRLIREPQKELERVSRFIGYRGDAHWQHDLKASNVSRERIRKFPLYGLIVESPIAIRLRREIVPQGFRGWVKSKLTMQKRPELGGKAKAELESVFDRDLMVLGEWLGTSLDCKNFKQKTAEETLNWVTSVG